MMRRSGDQKVVVSSAYVDHVSLEMKWITIAYVSGVSLGANACGNRFRGGTKVTSYGSKVAAS